MNPFKRKEINENFFEVIVLDGTALKNHNDKAYPILSENISRNLIGDLNAIAEKYSEKESNAKSDEAALNILMTKAVGDYFSLTVLLLERKFDFNNLFVVDHMREGTSERKKKKSENKVDCFHIDLRV